MKYLLYPLNFIHSLIFWLWFVASSIFFSVTGQIAGFVMSPFRDRGDVMYLFARMWARSLLAGAFIRIDAEGTEKTRLEDGETRLFLANHQGGFDILVLMACLPRIAYVAKQELFRTPFIGRYMRGLGFISIHREGIKGASNALEQAADRIKSGVSILMFPEGTRTATGQMGRFRRGPIQAARLAGVKIQPCALVGSYEVLRKGSLFVKAGRIKFRAGEARTLPAEMDREMEDRICLELRDETLGLMGQAI